MQIVLRMFEPIHMGLDHQTNKQVFLNGCSNGRSSGALRSHRMESEQFVRYMALECCKVFLTIMSVIHIRPARGQNCQEPTAFLPSHRCTRCNASEVLCVGPELIQTAWCQSCQGVVAGEEAQPPQEVSRAVGWGVKDEVDVCCL